MLRKSGGLAALAAVLLMSGSALAASDTAGGSLPALKVSIAGRTVLATGSVPAGAVTVQTTTTAAKGADLALVRLAPGVSFAQAFAQIGAHHGDLNALRGYATIVADDQVAKGTSTFATTLAAGDYVALNSDAKGAPPSAAFTVTATSAPAALPRPAATIAAEDFRFTGPATLHRGEIVRFENDGYVVHMIVAARYRTVAAARRAMGLLKAGHDSAAQKTASGFVSFMDPASTGAVQQAPITAAPGVYVLACFMTTEDGREHTMLGMERLLRITG